MVGKLLCCCLVKVQALVPEECIVAVEEAFDCPENIDDLVLQVGVAVLDTVEVVVAAVETVTVVVPLVDDWG